MKNATSISLKPGSDDDRPVVYNVLTDQQQPVANRVTEKMHLAALGFSTIRGRSNNCFAGDDDELVAASSSDHRLFIWSVAEGRGDRITDQAFLNLLVDHSMCVGGRLAGEEEKRKKSLVSSSIVSVGFELQQ